MKKTDSIYSDQFWEGATRIITINYTIHKHKVLSLMYIELFDGKKLKIIFSSRYSACSLITNCQNMLWWTNKETFFLLHFQAVQRFNSMQQILNLM